VRQRSGGAERASEVRCLSARRDERHLMKPAHVFFLRKMVQECACAVKDPDTDIAARATRNRTSGERLQRAAA